jgi:predicted ATPase/DNA-binding SARP family transcriptional activator
MRYGLLGPLLVHTETGEELPVRGAKLRALLSLLLVARGAPVRQDRLVEVLWGDGPPGNPRNALQAQVSQLRKLLGGDAIRATGGSYVLALDRDDLDLVVFERLVEEGLGVLGAGQPAAALRALERAGAMWRGTPLADVDDADFVGPERVRLEELHLTAVEARLQATLESGRHREAVSELESLVAGHPLRERLWELLMLALYRCGRQADALRAYQQAREVLVEELGVEPGPALDALEAAILAHDDGLAGPARHRRGNVGAPVSPLIGRDRELAVATRLLREHRLVTVVGPGGAGKTRLALAAARLDPPAGGSWLVSFEAVTDDEAVLPAVASSLGLTDDERRAGPAGMATQVISHLAGGPSLLVLDNCEHLLAGIAATAVELLARCPGLRLLATSREAVGITGEVLLPLGPLDDVAAAELFLQRAVAVRPDLVLDDAARSAVTGICQRLDGLPLAIELAAARSRSLPLTQIEERLADRFRLLTGGARTALPRQQTLRAVVDWSYDLLFDDERRLFARLAVFTGDFDLDAAEAVCADDVVPVEDVLDLLDRLVDKSLLLADHTSSVPRYRMLQTLWQYARERLVDSGEADLLHRRHAHHYPAVAESVEVRMRSGEALAIRDRLVHDLENLWATLDWFVDTGDAAAACRFADHLGWLWFLIGDWGQGARFCQRALTAAGAAPPGTRELIEIMRAYYVANASGHRAVLSVARHGVDLEAATRAVRQMGQPVAAAKALLLRVSIVQRTTDAELQLRLAEEAVTAATASGETWLVAAAHMLASVTMLRVGRPDDAADLASRAVSAFEEIGDHTLSIEARTVLLTLAELDGRLDDARRSAERIVELVDTLGIPAYRQWALSRLGFIRQASGDLDGADAAHRASLAIGRSRWGDALALIGQALVARQREELDRAGASLDGAIRIYDDFGAASEAALARTLAGWIELDGGDIDAAEALGTRAMSSIGAAGDAGIAAHASELLAACALARGDTAAASHLLRVSVAIGVPAGHGLWLLTRRDSENVRARLCSSAGTVEAGSMMAASQHHAGAALEPGPRPGCPG